MGLDFRVSCCGAKSCHLSSYLIFYIKEMKYRNEQPYIKRRISEARYLLEVDVFW